MYIYRNTNKKNIKSARKRYKECEICCCVGVCVCAWSSGGGGRVMIINGGEEKGEDQRIRASKGKLTFLGGIMAIADLGVSER